MANGDYGKGSAGRGKSEEIYLPGSPDYRQMMGSSAYKKDMYDSMAPKHTTPATEPNSGIQGAAAKKSSDATQDKTKDAPSGRPGNTYKKDYAMMSEKQPKEVQQAPGKAKGKKPIKSLSQLREVAKGKGA